MEGAEQKTQVILERYQSVRSEIQWRGVQRDATVIFALTFMGVTIGSIGSIGVWVLLSTFPLAYLASMWLHHDRRIGSLAHYLRNVIEPAMKQYDQLPGLEEHLDKYDGARSYQKRYHFTSIMSRVLFPFLQGGALGAGVYLFIKEGPLTAPYIILVAVAAVLIVATIVLTFINVKHIRVR